MGELHRQPSMTRVSTGISADPYRSDAIDAAQFSDGGRRFSAADSFRLDERGQPRVGVPWRSLLAALVLFGIGLTFLLLGTLHFRDKDHQVFIAFTVLGTLAFLPGVYAAYNLFHAIRGTPGFHLSDIAHFDDFRW